MKQLIRITLIIFGVIFGLYAGVWWAFIGGIIQVIVACKATTIVASTLAFGIAKIVFAPVIGWVVSFCCGFAILRVLADK